MMDEVEYQIYVREAIRRGREAADCGELVDQEEIERQMSQWLGTTQAAEGGGSQ